MAEYCSSYQLPSRLSILNAFCLASGTSKLDDLINQHFYFGTQDVAERLGSHFSQILRYCMSLFYLFGYVVWCHVSFSGNRSANCSFYRILSLLPSGSCLGMVHRFIIIFHQIKEFFSYAFMLFLVLATYTLHPLAAPWWLVLLRLGLAITYRLPPTSYY